MIWPIWFDVWPGRHRPRPLQHLQSPSQRGGEGIAAATAPCYGSGCPYCIGVHQFQAQCTSIHIIDQYHIMIYHVYVQLCVHTHIYVYYIYNKMYYHMHDVCMMYAWFRIPPAGPWECVRPEQHHLESKKRDQSGHKWPKHFHESPAVFAHDTWWQAKDETTCRILQGDTVHLYNYYWNHGTGAVHSSLRQRIRAVGNQSKEPNVSYRASLHPLLSGRWRPQWNLHKFNWNGMRNAHLKITTGNSPRLF